MDRRIANSRCVKQSRADDGKHSRENIQFESRVNTTELITKELAGVVKLGGYGGRGPESCVKMAQTDLIAVEWLQAGENTILSLNRCRVRAHPQGEQRL